MRLPIQSVGVSRLTHISDRIKGTVVPTTLARRFIRPIGAGRFIFRGTIGAIDGAGPTSCFCGRVCDGQGKNCTPCWCDPENCGSC